MLSCSEQDLCTFIKNNTCMLININNNPSTEVRRKNCNTANYNTYMNSCI